jgi:hypothetical protein
MFKFLSRVFVLKQVVDFLRSRRRARTARY